ncbi:EthD family reductase [Colwellia sp. 4_MG-2023]|jgi:uncharacterized protein (TIGR02118 family)|uniref:EthD family reductase n=1 Tax=unclassified Colwellia TaxID=196834 RepID=UPI0026E1A305|nr:MULTISPECIES: EthD family reductase [unclassified Colwellia]MDO6487636.1 EthD family reductase [Colwellia sp. 6_MG-2023]MDO6507365.1 EthD family reductase [Colwellia sp. 5_MG-2023]MDO6556098.1 EthD family reductase [Colwellia sp. 4_MG-2023]
MIKVSVMYPKSLDGTFDINYYCKTHISLVGELLGDSLKHVTVDSGLAGGAPGEDPAFIAMAHMTFDSVESFEEAFGPNAETIMADLANFTNIQPQIQISEIKL